MATLQSKGCVIADIKDLDDIKHHGEDSFDYEKEKNPIYLIRELEIIDELLKKIQASIFNGSYEKAIIISDHGASRLAVLHETENIWSMATSGEHSGRCCPVNELNSKPNAAIEENGFWVLANYDRFKGGRKANVEVHGGASLEEVAVPIIEITRKQTNIEAFILDSSRVITLAAKEHAALRIYVGVKSNSIGIMLNGQYYDALATSEPYIYSVDLADYTRKGTYTFEILNGNAEHILKLENALLERLKESGLDFVRNGARNHIPGNISVSFKDADGEAILHRLDLMGICVSTGSACDSVSTQISHVLKAIKLKDNYARGTIRISFGKENTFEEANIIAESLIRILKK